MYIYYEYVYKSEKNIPTVLELDCHADICFTYIRFELTHLIHYSINRFSSCPALMNTGPLDHIRYIKICLDIRSVTLSRTSNLQMCVNSTFPLLVEIPRHILKKKNTFKVYRTTPISIKGLHNKTFWITNILNQYTCLNIFLHRYQWVIAFIKSR